MNRVVPADRGASTRRSRSPTASRENSPIAVRLSRQLVREAAELDEADGWQRTNELAIEVFASGDAIEGATAFAEKRTPVWKSTLSAPSSRPSCRSRWAA